MNLGSSKHCLITCILVFCIVVIYRWNKIASNLKFKSSERSNTQPNIVLIVADDYGWNDIGYHGSEIQTPVLDTLANSGVKLENYYVQPVCTPSRSQLLTGRYQIHTGLQHHVILPAQRNALPSHIPTLPQKLKEQGYSTHMVGKWHLGFYKEEFLPTRRGFDSFYGFLCGAGDYFTHTQCCGGCGYDFYSNESIDRTAEGQYSTELFALRSVDIIEEHAIAKPEKPFFLYLPFQAVHIPLQAPSRYSDKYYFINSTKRQKYAGVVSAMDEAVGNVYKALEKTGLIDNTLIIFTTDNGGALDGGANNWPLRGVKCGSFEGGIKGVGFVHGNLLGVKQQVNDQLMHISDWFPTILTLAGGNVSGLALDGVNVWNSISEGQPSPRTEILYNIDEIENWLGQESVSDVFNTRVHAAIRRGSWKLLTGNPGLTRAEYSPPVTEEQRLKTRAEDEAIEKSLEISPRSRELPLQTKTGSVKNVWLYNLSEDPLETRDLTDVYPHVVQALLARLAEYNKTAIPCRFPPTDPLALPEFHGGVWKPWVTD